MPKQFKLYGISRVKDEVLKVAPSNPSKLKKLLLSSIEQTDDAELLKILKHDFLYPEVISEGTTVEKSYCEYHAVPWVHSMGFLANKQKQDWYVARYQEYLTQPIIEAFFYNEPQMLLDIIKALLQKNDNTLYAAFEKSLSHTDITKKMLFSWDEEIKNNLITQLNAMLVYGNSLTHETEKHLLIKQLYVDLINHPRFEQNSNVKSSIDSPYSSKFNTLKFKLEFIIKLHAQDQQLSQHQGWKRVITNVLTAVFLLFIPNLANRYFGSGDWLFFNKTTSQKKVQETERAVLSKLQETERAVLSK